MEGQSSINFLGVEISGSPFLVIPALIILVILFALSVAWATNDASKRGKNIFLAVLFIILTGWPISLFWWLWLRPPIKKEQSQAEQV